MPTSDDYAPRPWECRCGMVIGWMVRDEKGVVHLNVLRVPTEVRMMPIPTTPIERAQVWSGVEINGGKFLCQHCGAEKSWRAHGRALRRMRQTNKERETERL